MTRVVHDFTNVGDKLARFFGSLLREVLLGASTLLGHLSLVP